jgi:hypothetical protein
MSIAKKNADELRHILLNPNQVDKNLVLQGFDLLRGCARSTDHHRRRPRWSRTHAASWHWLRNRQHPRHRNGLEV